MQLLKIDHQVEYIIFLINAKRDSNRTIVSAWRSFLGDVFEIQKSY